MSARTFTYVGTRPIRHDGADKVTGRANFGADFSLPGMLHGAVLRSPHAHARIVSIDTSAAEALPGVKAVVTGRDFPKTDKKVWLGGEGALDLADMGDNLMAHDKALYHGHAVAAVAATTLAIAREAAAAHPGRLRNARAGDEPRAGAGRGCADPARRPEDVRQAAARRRPARPTSPGAWS